MDSNVETIWKLVDDLSYDMERYEYLIDDWEFDLEGTDLKGVKNILRICSKQASTMSTSLALAAGMLKRKMEEEE